MTVCRRRQSEAGFTLAEVLVALALLAIITAMVWSFYGFVTTQITQRQKRAYEFDDAYALLESIATNVRESRGTLLLDETEWVFLTRSGDTASYIFTDGNLKYKTLPLLCGGKPVKSFSFTGAGNDSLLDRNADGEVDFRELDQNGNGRIEGPETQSIAWITATVTVPSDEKKVFSIVATVKNNLQYDDDGFKTYF